MIAVEALSTSTVQAPNSIVDRSALSVESGGRHATMRSGRRAKKTAPSWRRSGCA